MIDLSRAKFVSSVERDILDLQMSVIKLIQVYSGNTGAVSLSAFLLMWYLCTCLSGLGILLVLPITASFVIVMCLNPCMGHVVQRSNTDKDYVHVYLQLVDNMSAGL